MKKLIFIIAFLGITAAVQAQDPNQPNAVLTLMENDDIVAKKTGYGTFTLDVKAITSDSTELHQMFFITEPVQTIRFEGNNDIIDITWDWLQGAVVEQIDTAFVYRLPYHGCQRARVHALSSADLNIFRGNFVNFITWQFDVKKGTKIYPMREGEVIAINEFGGVTIEHEDGSIAQYSALSTELKVAEGQKVTTRTQIGKAGEIDEESMVRVAIYYYRPNTRTMIYPNMFSQTVYVNPFFKRGQLVDGKKY